MAQRVGVAAMRGRGLLDMAVASPMSQQQPLVRSLIALSRLRASSRYHALSPSRQAVLRTDRLAGATSHDYSRPVASAKLSTDEAHQILVDQRLRRPVSPHLGIYKPEQTWFGTSAWMRITGATLSGSAYLFFAAYLVAPVVGWHLESASLAAAFAAWPFAAKGALKFALAFPFTFHFINGIKHLVYDLGKGFSKSTIKKVEIILWLSGVLSGLYLAFGL